MAANPKSVNDTKVNPHSWNSNVCLSQQAQSRADPPRRTSSSLMSLSVLDSVAPSMAR